MKCCKSANQEEENKLRKNNKKPCNLKSKWKKEENSLRKVS